MQAHLDIAGASVTGAHCGNYLFNVPCIISDISTIRGLMVAVTTQRATLVSYGGVA